MTDFAALVDERLADSIGPNEKDRVEALLVETRNATLDEVLRGLRSERDTDQIRAVIASVEFLRLPASVREP